MTTIRILCLADGAPTPFDGQFVKEYDPLREGESPLGEPMYCHLVTTPKRKKAMTFPNAAAAMMFCLQSRGTRPDGRPDRPLTAFTVSIG